MFQWLKTVGIFLGTLSGNAPKVKIYIGVFVLLLVLAWATQCRASTLNLESGATVVRGPAPVLAVTIMFPGAGPIDSDYECGITLIGSSTFKDEHQQNQAALSCLLVDGFYKMDIGLGVAYLQHTDAYNGSNTNFTLMLGYRFTPKWFIRARHFSNLGTVSPNLGRDWLIGGYKF